MFRSSLLFVVAAACSQFVSQPRFASAGDFHPSVRHVPAVHLNLAAVSVPQMFAPRIPVGHFPHSVLPQSRPSHSFVPQAHFPQSSIPQFGGFRFKHVETYRKWQSNRRVLGNPVGHETTIFSSRTQGSWMRFEHGYIVRYSSGRTFIVHGGIGQAWLDAGGAYGKLGFPKGNEFEFNTQGDDAQVFERGLIFWNPTIGRFVVGPNKPKV